MTGETPSRPPLSRPPLPEPSPAEAAPAGLSRRRALALSAAAAAGGLAGACTYAATPDPKLTSLDATRMASIPSIDKGPEFERWVVADPTGEAPGTIVVDTPSRHLYLVLPGRKAVRYGVAVGSEAHGWSGTAVVARKAEWPRWTPPAEMVARWPHLKPTLAAGGLPGGPDNPLGARALYLYQGNRDTLYRIHGTNEPETIGLSVSSGCIRMRNIDVVELYERVPTGTKVIVRPQSARRITPLTG